MNAKSLFVLVLTVLVLTGCSDWDRGETAHIFIDSKDFSPEQMGAIHEAVAEWEESLGGFVHFVYVDEKGSDDLIVIRSATVQEMDERYESGRTGNTNTDPWACGGGITIARDMSMKRFKKSVLHELGHSLGLGHSEGKTIMAPNLNEMPSHITCEDVTHFCEKSDCDASSLPLCQG